MIIPKGVFVYIPHVKMLSDHAPTLEEFADAAMISLARHWQKLRNKAAWNHNRDEFKRAGLSRIN